MCCELCANLAEQNETTQQYRKMIVNERHNGKNRTFFVAFFEFKHLDNKKNAIEIYKGKN